MCALFARLNCAITSSDPDNFRAQHPKRRIESGFTQVEMVPAAKGRHTVPKLPVCQASRWTIYID